MLRHLKCQLKKLHVILVCNKGLKKVFLEVPIIVFKNNNNNRKSNLMLAALPDINEEDKCKLCGGKGSPCQLGSHIKNTNTFRSKH